MSRRLDDDWEEAKAPDQTIEQQIENIILMYGYDTEAVIEDLVLQQYPEKVIQAHTDLLDESKQAILQLLKETRTKGYSDGFQMGQFERDMDNIYGTEELTPKDNK